MKRKILLSTILAALAATGAKAQVVNFHDDHNGNWEAATVPLPPSLTGGLNNDAGSYYYQSYMELFAGQGAFVDPGNNIWNGFGKTGGYNFDIPIFYSGPTNSGDYYPAGLNVWPQQAGNPGNPYAAYSYTSYTYGTYSTGWISTTGSSLFQAYLGGPTVSGNSDSSGNWTPVTLSVGNAAITNYTGDFLAAHTRDSIKSPVQNGSPAFLLENSAFQATNTANPWGTNVFTLGNVPITNALGLPNTYGLYIYGANYSNKAATVFSVSSGNAHFGIAGTTNSAASGVPTAFVEGTTFVIWENVTPDTNGDITITAQANSAARATGAKDTPGFSDVNGFQLIFNPPPTAVSCTYAQNVYAGKTATFSFTPAFMTNATFTTASFQWQSIIDGVTNPLTDGGPISGSATTNLTITNVTSANVGLYQCVLSSGLGTNVSPLVPLTLLTSVYTNVLTTSSSTVSDFGDISGPPYAGPFNAVPPTFYMTDAEAIDGTLYQYVNFGSNGSVAPFQGPVGVNFTPTAGSTIVSGLRIFTASRRPEDDPADYYLYGSTNSGKTYSFISGGPLALPAQRNAAAGAINVTNQVLQEVDFVNTNVYDSYQLVFSNVVNNALASNGLQVAEIQLLGTNGALPPQITTQPATNMVLLVGSSLTNSVKAIGTATIHYQWYFDGHAISSATASALSVTNLQITNSGSYYCVVTNSYPGASTSSVLNLTVVSPTPYEVALQALKPLAYWPLNETSGSTAFEYIHGMNGTYDGNVTLAEPGVPFAGFGSPSLSAAFDGSTAYVDIPVGYLNARGSLTIMAWVKPATNGFLTDIIGHGASSYSLAETPSGDAAFFDDGGGCTNPISITDGNWHHVVGVRTNGAGINTFIYVDGFLFTSNSTASGNLPSTSSDVWIGGAPDLTAGLFSGEICHAAIISSALTAAQIEGLYSADEGPPDVLVPSSVTVDENGSVAIASTASGTQPYSYQWYYEQGASTNLISGATGSTLQLTNVQLIQSNYLYFVVVSNTYGATTSSVVALNILYGPPALFSDVRTNLEVVVGSPVTMSASFTGTLPFSYQWTYNGHPLSSGPRISGVTSSTLTINPALLTDGGIYQLVVTNVDGTGQSSQAALTVLPFAGFIGVGSNWILNAEGTLTAGFLLTNVLEVTDGTSDEGLSCFSIDPVYVGAFQATFTYQDVLPSGGGANGSCFVLQNDPRGVLAIGANGSTNYGSDGSGEGYAADGTIPGISNSVCLVFNVYSGETGGSGVALGANANIITPYTNTAPVVLTNGDPINVTVTYIGGQLSVLLQDTLSTNSWSMTTNVNIPALVKSNMAYVGFTGSSGDATAVQTFSNLQYFVEYAPAFLVVPTNVTVTNGGSPVVFYSSAVGTAPFGYQWQVNGINLTDGPSPIGFGATVAGSLTSNLTVTGYTLNDNGDLYTVVASNAIGTNSASATLTVLTDGMVVSSSTQLTNITVSGTQLIFSYTTVAGPIYQVEYTTNLSSGGWVPVGSAVVGTGAAVSATNNINSTGQQYFRVAITPP